MPETASCRRPVTVIVLAVFAMTVCLFAIFGGIGMRQAYADDTENIAFSVPLQVPFAAKADGTVIGPSASAWRIENKGTRPLRMKDVAASEFDDGTTASAVSEAMPVADTSTRGIWSINVGPGGGASLTASVDGTIEIPVGGSAGFTWSANPSDSTKHAVGPAPMVLGAVSFTLGGADRVAFAVYSADDGTLNFYKRMDVPEVGDTFEGKTVAAVYTGFETANYHLLGYDPATNNWNSCDTNTPWFDIRNNVTSINVVDQGIKPYNLKFFFRRFENLESSDLVNFDLSETVSIDSMFILCKSLKIVKIPGISRQCTDFKDAFACCPALTNLEFGNSDFSGGKRFYHMFNCDSSLLYDCTDWNVSPDAEHHGFNSVAPGVVLPKPWQPTAFAVFSSDDGSLNFYKREFKNLPETGDTFENKPVTEVYTGFENTCFSIQTSDDEMAHDWTCNALPWWNRRDSVKTATVVDTGITPTSICGWFMRMSNLVTVDLSNLDCRNTYTAWCAFLRCTLLTSLKSPKNFNPIDLSDFVYNCTNLKDLDTSTWNMSRCQNIGWGFSGCHSLETIPGAESWNTSSLNYTNGAFAYCNLLKLDCSDWKVQVNADHKEFNHESPGVILPKPWQPTAFAVFSADDGSLDFYKREFNDMPKAGETFEGKAVTEVYTGFENTEYHVVSVGSDGTSYDADAKTNTPWFGRRKNIKTVQVVDSGIKPKSIQSWFQGLDNATNLSMSKLDVSTCANFYNAFANCQAATSIDISGWSAKPVNMTQMFYMCKSISSIDLSGFDGSRNITLNSTFHACFALDDIKFGNKWTTAAVENFGCTFFGTKFSKLDVSGWNTSNGYIFRGTFGDMGNLEEIDISGWTNAGAENEPGILSTFISDIKLRTVKVGTGWDWSKSNAKLPAISGENVAGADGKWYAASDGTGYDPGAVPSGKTDIYYSVAPSTFAVFSADDGSLDFYNRAGKPAVGDTWQGKSVDGVYTGFETTLYSAAWDDEHTSLNNGPANTPWYEHHTDILSVSVIDCGIKPYSMRFWFQLLLNLKTVDIKKLDVSEYRDWQHTFWCCRSLTELDLSGMNVSQLGNIESMFAHCRSLKSVNFSGWKGSPTASGIMFNACRSLESIDFGNIDFSKTEAAHSMFENCNSLILDCTNWNISADIRHDNFNAGAPGVIAPKAWQQKAFAVFSADDGPLDFYKREFKDVIPRLRD